MIVIETERFQLRHLTTEDAQMFYALNLDPEVTRYTGDEAFHSISEAWMFLEKYVESNYIEHGFGRWAIVEKETSNTWGWCGLKKRTSGEIDLGYRIFKKYWGKGCARECGEACLNHAFEELKIEKLIGEAVPENVASIKIMERLGFEFLRNGADHGFETKIYQIKKENYKSPK